MDATDTSVHDVVRFLYNNGYRQIKHLGKGGFASVLSAKMFNEKDVAIKIVKNEKCWDLEESVWPLLNHKNVLPILEIIEVKELNLKLFVMPIQPYVLHKVLSSENFLTDKNGLQRVKFWLIDILNGMNYLHSSGYAHLDLKNDNILISADDTAIICDFSGIHEINVPLRRLCSPKLFRPPECYDVHLYKNVEGASCDIWLFGIMTLNILTRNWPTLTMGAVKNVADWKVKAEPVLKEVLKKPAFFHLMRKSFPCVAIPDEELLLAHEFVSSIMQWDQSKRPPVEQILGHPFLRDLVIGDNLYELNTKPELASSVLTSPSTEILIETKATCGSSSMEELKTESNESVAILNDLNNQHSESKELVHEKDDSLSDIKKSNEKVTFLIDRGHQYFDNKAFVHKKDDISPVIEKSINTAVSNIQEFDVGETSTTGNAFPKNKKKRTKRIKEWIIKKWNRIFEKKKKHIPLSEESE